MARILYWNIKNFTDKRINSTKRQKVRDDDEWGAIPPGRQCLNVVTSTLTRPTAAGVAVQFDFIIVVEVVGTGGNPAEGQLVDGEGRAGCLNLLGIIRNVAPGGINWMLVPPVVTGAGGMREAVAVYYRSDLWHFLGPLTWPAAYPPAFNGALPNGNIPGNYPFRGGQPFNLGTGQFNFSQPGGGAAVLFPAAGNRKPWLTAFGDVGNANNLIRIFALHTSPPTAVAATANLVLTNSIGTRPIDAANQTDLIVGDFNVDNTNPANFAGGGPFNALLNLAPPYTALIQTPGGLNVQYNSYYHTLGYPAGQDGGGTAAIMDDSGVNPAWLGFYPGHHYSDLSVDNALVRYRGGAAAPANHHMTILPRTRSLPYRAPAGPPLVMPMLGYFGADSLMEETIDGLFALRMANPGWRNREDMNRRFRSWQNYGRIYGVSDHFPILFDI